MPSKTITTILSENVNVGKLNIIDAVNVTGSDENLPTEKAVKAYIDAGDGQLASGLSSLTSTVNGHTSAIAGKQAKLTSGTKAADSAGAAGDWSFDATNLYICVAANSWKTVALSDIV